MTAVRNDFLTEDHGPLPARPAAPRLDAPTFDDANPWAVRVAGRYCPAGPDRHLDRGYSRRHQ